MFSPMKIDHSSQQFGRTDRRASGLTEKPRIYEIYRQAGYCTVCLSDGLTLQGKRKNAIGISREISYNKWLDSATR